MLQKFIYFLSIFIFVGSSWAATESKGTDDAWLKDLPVMVRRDARQFYNTVHFSELSGNPYAVYFQGALIGKTFGVAGGADEALNTTLRQLVTPREASTTRSYFRKSFDIEDAKLTVRRSFENVNEWHRQFSEYFNGELASLVQHSNAFALFVKGFMAYDHGVINSNDHEKSIGEWYLQQAANLYCLPALNFLGWMYEKSDTKLAAVAREKRDHYLVADLKGNPQEVIRYVIDENVFGTSFAPSYCGGCCRKGRLIEGFPSISPAEHFKESFLETFGTLNKTFYGEALSHLNKTTGSMRRASYLTTQSRFWFTTSVLTPLATMGISALQLWSGYATMPKDTPHDAKNIISTITRSALAALVTTTVTFSYNVWVLSKSSDMVKLDENILKDQCALTALYLTVTKGEGALPKAGETEAEKVINYWFQETTGFRPFFKKLTLSQKILLRR
jgi:hypothetical protein